MIDVELPFLQMLKIKTLYEFLSKLDFLRMYHCDLSDFTC